MEGRVDGKESPWIETATHGRFYYLRPDLSDISIVDIATHLAYEPRFAGALQVPYCVAEHSIHVARLASKDAKLQALFHDAHEAYTKDIPSPLKRALAFIAGYDIVKKLVEPIDRMIEQTFDFKFLHHKSQIAKWDLAMLKVEAEVVLQTKDYDQWGLPIVPPPYEVEAGAFRGMRQEFVSADNYIEYCRDRFLECYERWSK